MNDNDQLTQALRVLGEVLEGRGLTYELIVIGGGALLLHDLLRRPTLDLDVVARVEGEQWVTSKPLPEPLVEAVRDVADALGLAREPRDEKDWLNGGPAFICKLGLPEGFAERATKLQFSTLTIRVASRQDLITLKLWAATDSTRGPRRAVDVRDLQQLKPTPAELRASARWCALKDGRDDFLSHELAPVLATLGFELGEVADG
jgi:hypothetical protein